MPDYISILIQVLSVINVLFAIVVIFSERKNPAGTWAWLLVLITIPYIGFFLYLLIGLDSRKYRTFAAKAKNDEETFEKLIKKQFPSLLFIRSQKNYANQRDMIRIEGTENVNDLVRLNFSDGHGAVTYNNSVTLYHDGNTKFDALIDDIRGARSFVHILYYIMHDDDLGRRIIAALAEKAREGVEVRLLVDGMGCRTTPSKFYKPLRDAGGKVAIFMPPHFIRINFRNHRKLAVIDGVTGYIGGLNIGDEYLGKVKRFGYWRDSHIRICGDAVKCLEIRFMLDWNFCSSEKMRLIESYYPPFDKSTVPPTNPDSGQISGNAPMQIVSSGPDTKWSYIHYGYNKMMSEAERSIYIQTPYFSPDDSIFELLRIAALSGIDVRIMIPANPDHPFVYWASLSYLGELLNAGVKCYQYQKGFLHSKLLMIDGLATSVGTANMDVRSFKLNFEVNAFIYDRPITKAFEEKFLKDLSDCSEITQEWYNKRSALTRIRESVSRLLSPLL